MGLRSAHHTLALPLLDPQWKDCSRSAPAPPRGPSHGRQFSTNFSNLSSSHGLQLFTKCPSVGPSHGLQSFRNRLLQHGSPMGSQALPANLLRRGLLSPWVRRSWQEPAPAWASHGVTALFRHPPAPAWGPFHGLQVEICSTVDLHGLQWDSLPHHGLHQELRGKALCSGAWSTSCTARIMNFFAGSPLVLFLLMVACFRKLIHFRPDTPVRGMGIICIL